MPEDKFNFSPESLNIPGSDYKGVRTFALQVKHVAASNYALWSPLTGDKFPEDFMGGNGPENLKTKADIIKFLKDYFCFGPQGRGFLDDGKYVAEPRRGTKSPRLFPAYIWHRPCIRPLRADGGVPADERNCAASQPRKVRLNPGAEEGTRLRLQDRQCLCGFALPNPLSCKDAHWRYRNYARVLVKINVPVFGASGSQLVAKGPPSRKGRP